MVQVDIATQQLSMNVQQGPAGLWPPVWVVKQHTRHKRPHIKFRHGLSCSVCLYAMRNFLHLLVVLFGMRPLSSWPDDLTSNAVSSMT